MKKILLVLAGLLPACLPLFANNEVLAVLRQDASGSQYWEYTSGNINPADPCIGFEFRMTFAFPAGYTAVKEFDWYANNTLIKTTTQVSYDQNNTPYAETNMQLIAPTTDIVCKVIYKKADNSVSPTYASPAFRLYGKPLYLILNGPTTVDALPQNVSYSITTNYSSTPSGTFAPLTGTYSTTWQAPPGWTQTSLTNGGNNVSFTTDNFTGGPLYATTTMNCGYHNTFPTSVTITRSHPATSFTTPSPTAVCGFQNGTPVTATFSVYPVNGASSYTYTLTPNGVNATIEGTSFDGTNGQTTLTTTSTAVTLNLSGMQNEYIALNVKVNYSDGGSSYFSTLIVDWTTMTFDGPFAWSWNPDGVNFSATAPSIPGAYYYWYMDGFMVDQGYSTTTFLMWHGEYALECQAKTDCGMSELYSEPIGGYTMMSVAGRFNVYPNPSRGRVTVDLKDINKKAPVAGEFKEIREIRIVDKLGNVRNTFKYAPGTKSATLNIGGLPNDVYMLQITDGKNRVSGQLNKIN